LWRRKLARLCGFRKREIAFLREYLHFASGTSCKNTFARVLATLDPEEFRRCFIAWVSALQNTSQDEREVIAIDGKTLRNSANATEETTTIHMASAFVTRVRLVLAQLAVNFAD